MGNRNAKSGKVKPIRYDIFAIIWTFVIMGLTFTPGPNIPPLPHWKLISFDTFVHAVIFAVLVFLTANFFRTSRNDNIFKRSPFISAFVLSVTFGCLIEVIQLYIPGRSFDYFDMLSNSIGATIGLFVVFIQRYFYPSSSI